jgi:hypothetical protein
VDRRLPVLGRTVERYQYYEFTATDRLSICGGQILSTCGAAHVRYAGARRSVCGGIRAASLFYSLSRLAESEPAAGLNELVVHANPGISSNKRGR